MKLTTSNSTNISRQRFGMNKDSKEFAEELFNSVARRRNILTGHDSINKKQLKEFWDEISDQSFDSRLRIFLDMVDKDADGKITEDEVRKILSISASANKLSNIDEYALLIMEELAPDNNGYIMIEHFEELLLQAQTQSQKMRQMLTQKHKISGNAIRRWYEYSRGFIVIFNWFGYSDGGINQSERGRKVLIPFYLVILSNHYLGFITPSAAPPNHYLGFLTWRLCNGNISVITWWKCKDRNNLHNDFCFKSC